ncbi:MAG: DNA primase [Candidatus Thermoplasmatota archaeon]|nr:DNA primase [Candidatus Thermoplasmatota archaeon]
MRPSTLEERQQFYGHEFDVRSLRRWIGPRHGRLKFAMILGRHTGIVVPRHAAHKNDVVVIDKWDTASDLRDYALDYLPEGTYYDRNRYRDVSKCVECGEDRRGCADCYNYCGQQLAFDLDPENVDCPWHGHIGQKIDRGRKLSFCMYEFNVVRKQAMELASELRREYDRVGMVYSGRGFHVVVDDERAYALSRSERKKVARIFGRRYAIDEWVTEGGSRLLRLPYSLNGLVSRKCVIIEEERDLVEFDPRSSDMVLPGFVHSP